MSIIELRNVSRARGEGAHRVDALSRVHISVRGGEIVLVEGPSGAGKTTLLCVAAGLLAPDHGTVAIGGVDLARLHERERRAHRARRIGFVFQRANLLEGLTVRENVLLAAHLANVPPALASERADALLDALSVLHLRARYPRAISGGEEQRVGIARALVHDPVAVFADEPTASLDRSSGRDVATTFARLARERGIAVLVASHDPRLREFATRRLHLEDGSLGEPLDAAAQPLNESRRSAV